MSTLTHSNGISMHRAFTLFLQFLLLLIGAAVLTFMLIEPNFEGVNAGATFTEIYFQDPFLAYAYIGSIPFFVALYQAARFLGQMEQKNFQTAAKAARSIKYCGMILAAAILGAELFFIFPMRGQDDITGGLMMGLVTFLISVVIAIVASVIERSVRKKI